MSKHQEHFGRKFYQDKKTGYWISTDYRIDKPRVRAHQWVWLNIHRVIPKGYHIHHINDDKSDNRIENLELIHGPRHMSHHMSHHMKDTLRKQKARENCEKIRPLTKKWHASEEGKAWHKLHALKCKFGKNNPIDYKCIRCEKDFKSSKLSNTKFCTNACKSQWRRDKKIDDIEKTCNICLKSYKSSKYSKSKTCSRICGKKLVKKNEDTIGCKLNG